MKTTILVILGFFLINSSVFANDSETDPNIIIEEMLCEIMLVNSGYDVAISTKEVELKHISALLSSAESTDEKVNLMIAKDHIKDQIIRLEADNNADISRIRYIKGLQIVKILYEKILSLDHHFASVRTLSEINKISNPNQYPEYSKLKDLIKEKKDKKNSVELTSLLGTNTIVSVVQTFTNMVGSSLTKEEKDKELASIECILDFTLRMQNDLNTIYFETAFLQTSNDKMKEDIEILFRDYTKPINYTSTLQVCRGNDDWDAVKTKMDEYIAKMKASDGANQKKMAIDLEFPIDRLLQFITQYNNFIDQGGKFYEKFKIILNSYENEKQCETKLPLEYKKLKGDIDVAIDKFKVAYKPVEVNGSKMKEIIYGINEFQ